MSEFSESDRPDLPPALAPAALASLSIHVAIAFALATVLSPRPFAWGSSSAALSVELVSPRPTPQLPVVAVTAPAPQFASAPKMRPTPPALPANPDPAATPAAGTAPVPVESAPPPVATQASLTLGRIRMAENYAALSGLPEELVLRSQGEFLIEVDKLVRVVRNPDVVYPSDALQARREGTVVAWLALDREGAIVETIIVSGEPEFAAAVEAALPSAQFLPAENGGETVPFYLIMTFEFR
ncbi:MAG: energy transducer TonB [Casimicrobiaceae bacterium]